MKARRCRTGHSAKNNLGHHLDGRVNCLVELSVTNYGTELKVEREVERIVFGVAGNIHGNQQFSKTGVALSNGKTRRRTRPRITSKSHRSSPVWTIAQFPREQTLRTPLEFRFATPFLREPAWT